MKRMLAGLLAVLLLTGRAGAVSAEAWIVLDTLTGTVRAEGNADARMRIASLTKVAAAMAALNLLDPDSAVTVPEAACRVEGSRMGLVPGERVSVRMLLYGLLLSSGNDAALALADAADAGETAGGIAMVPDRALRAAGEAGADAAGDQALVAEMNRIAEDLGLADTHFANPHGLDAEGHYSTARDLSVLAAAAMADPRLREITKTRNFRGEGYSLHTHNKLLWSLAGCEGVKTGFTKAAGRCLISSVSRGGRRMVAVTLNAPDDWNDHRALYDAAFAGMEERVYLPEGAGFGLRVESGERHTVTARAAGTLAAMLTDEEAARAECRVYLPAFVYAPLQAGAAAGEAALRLDGRVIARVPLVYEIDVGEKQPSARERLLSVLRRWLG